MEFTSDRKRMSVLVRDLVENWVILYTKGADNVILERLEASESEAVKNWDKSFSSKNYTTSKQSILDHTLRFVNESSKLGFRTLLIAIKLVEDNELDAFEQDCAAAERDIENRDFLLEETYSLLECGLTLLGATAVEDCL